MAKQPIVEAVEAIIDMSNSRQKERSMSNHYHTQTIRFQAEYLNASINAGELTIDVPMIPFDGSIFTEQAREAMRDVGLTERDIDDATETLLDGLMVKTLAALLLKARR